MYGDLTSNEVTKYDWLLVLIKYSDKTKITFHNDCADNVFSFIEKHNPVLIGHNARYYDQFILKGILALNSKGTKNPVSTFPLLLNLNL